MCTKLHLRALSALFMVTLAQTQLQASGSVTTQAVNVKIQGVAVVEWYGAFPDGQYVGLFRLTSSTPDCPRAAGLIDLSTTQGQALWSVAEAAASQGQSVNISFLTQGPRNYCVTQTITTSP